MTNHELAQLKGMIAAGGPDFSDPTDVVRPMFEGMLQSFPVDESFVFGERHLGGVPALTLDAAGETDAVLLYIHGGGYIIGSASAYRGLSGLLARAAGASLVSIEYRLAEEHIFPAAIDDSYAAYRALLAEGTAPERIIVVGDSAGGGLVLALLQRLRDEGLPQPAGAVALSPWADLTLSGESVTTKAEADGSLDEPGLRSAADRYLAGQDPKAPYASPLFGDFRGIAPLLIEVGSAEILLSDSTRVAEKAASAEVDVTLHVWPDLPHDWSLFAFMLSEGRDMIDEVGRWAAAKLEPAVEPERELVGEA